MTRAPEVGTAQDPDAVLVQQASAGDMAAFEQLVMRHADALHGALLRFGLDHGEAQDVAQETFLRAWRSLSRFEARSRFFTWLYRIGFNEAQRRLAKRPAAGAVVSTEDRPLDDLAAEGPGPVGTLEREELRATLAEGLRELPADLRAPVVLRDVEGLSTSEAASVLDLGEAAFKSRLHRGRMALRAMLAPRLSGLPGFG
ncbi:MAG TPA: sigma-70 family RNA polymerase sigma factor [Thermoleophilaceae bacterium]|jgi:RNA polymerase sigma-70 factor (ECF subfamily)